MTKSINLIVACSENRVIGRNGRLPFDIPEDKTWFHQRTAGNVVIMGRISFEQWPKSVSGGRLPVVITRDHSIASEHVRVASNVDEALAIARNLPGEIMVCGGERIYEETLPLAHRLFLTLVHADLPGDTYFPEWRHLPWQEKLKQERRDANFSYCFSILEK